MKKRAGSETRSNAARLESRTKGPRSLAISHRGLRCEVASPRPSLSPEGTFKNLSIHFPEGAVIKLQFRSERSNGNSGDNGEEVYRLVDIGIELESVGLGAEAIGALEEEFKSVS